MNIEKVSINNSVKGVADFVAGYDLKFTNQAKNFTPPGAREYPDLRSIKIERKVSQEDLEEIEMELMPGYRLSWQYLGIGDVLPYYAENTKTQIFVRNVDINHKINFLSTLSIS